VAGKRQGMAKGSGTRSGLLWEVERLLNEVKELPQVLLMENVPQVISDANIADFHKWQDFLTEKGYTNYVEILNAKDFGVAQNRERCFMVSLLGKWNYKFPKPIPLTKTMKDYLEDEVDEKYYINSEKANKLIQQLMESGQLEGVKTCVDGTINEPRQIDTMNCIKARYDAGISNFRSEGGMVVERS
jgi:DNA (cytosine-5)-methyltransferase 1